MVAQLSSLNLLKTSKHRTLLALGVGFSALALLPSPAYAQFDTAAIDWAMEELCAHINGHLGGLLVTVSAFGAIVAAAFGTYRVFHGTIITAVGAFAIVNILSLSFDTTAISGCTKGAKNGTARTAPPAASRHAIDAANLGLEKGVIGSAPSSNYEDREDEAVNLVD